MARYVPIELIQSLSGKVCEHSDTYFARRNNTLYTVKRCNTRTKPFTEAEKQRQSNFKTAAANTTAALADENKRTTYQEQFKNQRKYATLRGYVFAQELAKL